MNDVNEMIRSGLRGNGGGQGPAVVALNDVQLVIMVAAQNRLEPPAAAVAWATDLIAEAVVQTNGGALMRAVEAAKLRATT